jgi:methyl-accepting chemotaxis protein
MIEIGEGPDPSSDAVKASHIILFLHENFWPPVLFALLAIGLHSVRISHKIAGPLYRINIFFKDVIKGISPKPIKLRNDDFLSEEVTVINQAMEGLRSHVMEIKEAQAQLGNIISKCSDKLDDASKNEIAAYIKDISTKANEVGDKIESIKVIE